MSTEQGARFATFSATDPSRNFCRPAVSCMPMSSRSALSERALRRISDGDFVKSIS